MHLGAVQEEAVVGPRRPVHEAKGAVGEADLVGPQEHPGGIAHLLGGLLDLLHPPLLHHRRLGRVDVVRLQPIDGQLAQVDDADGRRILEVASGREGATSEVKIVAACATG